MIIYYRPDYPGDNEIIVNTGLEPCTGCGCKHGENHIVTVGDFDDSQMLQFFKSSIEYILDYEIDKSDERHQLLTDLMNSNDCDNWKIMYEIINNM